MISGLFSKSIFIIVLVQSFAVSAGERISLECKLDTDSKFMFQRFNETYLESLAAMGEESTESSTSIMLLLLSYEFTLKGIEVDKDVDETLNMGGLERIGHQYKWAPDKLGYTNFMSSIWTVSSIDREDLSYIVSRRDYADPSDKGLDGYSGMCKIIEFKTKF